MDEPGGITVRFIKVGRTTQVRQGGSTVVVPFIRLSGKWLERAGFLEGDMIEIAAADGEIRMVRRDGESTSVWAQGELF